MANEDHRGRILHKINSRSVTILGMIILMFAGCVMVYLGIKDVGYIDIQSAFVTGQLRTGFVGIIVIAIAAVPLIVAIRFNPVTHKGDRTIYFKLRNGTEVRITGVQSMRETLAKLKEVLGPDIVASGDANDQP